MQFNQSTQQSNSSSIHKLIAESVFFSKFLTERRRYISKMDELVYAQNTTSYTHLFNFEKNFVPQHAQMWMKDHFPYCFLYCALYAILIFGSKLYMSNRPKYDLRRGLAMWSAGLALFSITAVYRTMPIMFHLMRHRGLYYNICASNIRDQDPILSYWGYLFALSKLVEFGDTFFIVLRKQPLIFLHWYHHIVTFLYSWLSYLEDARYAMWFAFINGFIHSCMYTYYTFKAIGYRLPRWLAMTITVMQLSQMFVGSSLTMIAYYYVYIAKVECQVTPLNITVAGIMYISYVILFARFFVQAYLSDKSSKDVKKKTEANNKLKAN